MSPSRRRSTLATKYLTRLVRNPIYDMDLLVKEIRTLCLFKNGYWGGRMDRVLQEQGFVDEEAPRELSVLMHLDGKGRK